MYSVAVLVLTVLGLASALSAGGAGDQQRQHPVHEVLAEREYFYVGGQYVNRSVVGDESDAKAAGRVKNHD